MIPCPKPFADNLSYRARPRLTPPYHKSREASVKTARPFWLARVAVVALVLSFFSACDDTTEPVFELGPESTADLLDDLVADFVGENEAAHSMEYFAEYIGQAVGGGLPALAGDPFFSAVPATIPDFLEGVTFEWNDLEGGYVPGERPGAPANGLRFILYAVNPITGVPVEPFTEIGYLEVSDSSTWPSLNISMSVVIGTDTMIFGRVTGFLGDGPQWIAVDGYLSDGTEDLDYDLYASEAGEMEYGLTYGAFEALWSITYGELGDEIVATFTDGTNTLVFTLGVDQGTITEGSGITFNGDPVAIIEGYFDETGAVVTITNAVGDPLSAAELAALEDVFGVMEDLGEFMEGLFEFAFMMAYLAQPVQ
jgi:hypothetical protein